MRRTFRWERKYLYWGITAFLVIAASIVFYLLLKYIPILKALISKLMGILSPFVWGLILTYLLSPMMLFFEKSMFLPLGKKLFKKSKNPNAGKGFARSCSVLLSIIVLLLILVVLVWLIIPQMYSSLETIVTSSPAYIDQVSVWAGKTLEDHPELEKYVVDSFGSINTSVADILKSSVLPKLGSMVTNVTTGVVYVLKGVYNLVIGIVVSIYLLAKIEKLLSHSRRIMYSIFTVEAAEKIRKGLGFCNETFMGFITGKLLDSAIIGLICYIGCALLKIPYAVLVSVIVGVTNVIPFFGPFIGAIPTGLIILLVSPIKCLIFLIFVFVLQQVDGNLIGPKILGSSIGVNGFWVMFSIILGGGLFGFWGMLLGVPVFVIIYTGINKLIDRKLIRSDLPKDAASYEDLKYVDEITREAIKNKK